MISNPTQRPDNRTLLQNRRHLLPVAALLATGLLLGLHQRSIWILENETAALQKRNEAARHAPPLNRSRLPAVDKDTADRNRLVGRIASASQDGLPDVRSALKLKVRLFALDGEELKAALDEIAALPLDRDERSVVDEFLIEFLAEKDPALALDRYFDDRNSDARGHGFRLANVFRNWMQQDRTAATAWLDTRVAAGKFESGSLEADNRDHLYFEHERFSALFKSDPEAAASRLAKMPEDLRKEILRRGVESLMPGSEKAFATLVRTQLPIDQHGMALARVTDTMIRTSGFEEVGWFLDKIHATPGERVEIARSAASAGIFRLEADRRLDPSSFIEMRAWLRSLAPDIADSLAGQALGDLVSSRVKWDDRARLLEEIHAGNPSDDLLISFLMGRSSREHPGRDAVLELAAKITAEAKRAEVLALLNR